MLSKNTKIIYLSGTRADYGLMRRTLLALHERCELDVVVTGMHLDKKFGYTLNEIKNDGLRIFKKIPSPFSGDTFFKALKNFSQLTGSLAELLKSKTYTYALVEGDRLEALALAIAAAQFGIPVIHQGGGDVSGSLDDQTRNAITSFATLHLAGNKESAKRVLKQGIAPKCIFQLGEPGLDDIVDRSFSSPEVLFKKYGISNKKPFLLLLQHPDTTEKISPELQIQAVVDAVNAINLPTIALFSNNDPGGRAMIKWLETAAQKNTEIKIFSHLPRPDFLALLEACRVAVGNSSSFLIEASFLGTPVVLVGDRQQGRLQGKHVMATDYNSTHIAKKINAQLKKTYAAEKIYGRGTFTESFISLLEKYV